MHELLSNPAIQSGIVPFFVTLLSGLLLKRAGWYWIGLCLALGFFAAVYLIAGIQFSPLTSTRKIIILGLIAIAAGILLDVYSYDRSWIKSVLFFAGVGGTMWMIWPSLNLRQGYSFFALAAGSCAYAGWMVASMENLREQPARASSAILALGLGTGIAALSGVSALIAQIALALGAAGGAYWLLCFSKGSEPGSLGTLPSGLLAGLIGVAALVYGKLPRFSLVVLALIPLLVRIPLPRTCPRWLETVIMAILALSAAAGAILWTRHVLGGFHL